MNREELTRLVGQGEGETLEFKATTGQRTRGVETACGMANGRGGYVVFGVQPDGRITGQNVTARTLEDLARELRKLTPAPLFGIDVVDLGGDLAALVLAVPGMGGPFQFDGRPFERVGATTQVMTGDRYARLLYERGHAQHRWELQVAPGVSLEDLDEEEVVRTVDEAVRRGRLADPGTRDTVDLLRGLHLLDREGRIVNAAVALFGRSGFLQSHYPQCLLRQARFRGIDRTEYLDEKQEFGNIFALYQSAQQFWIRHLPVSGRIVAGIFERSDDPLYPPAALREALANALAHRDYMAGGGSVSLAIYDDRLDVVSVGPLPFGQRPEDLVEPHTSRPWNPSIAHVMYLRGLMETWGRGVGKMRELAVRAGLDPPEILATRDEVTVRFRQRSGSPAQAAVEELSGLQQEILHLVEEHGSLSLPKLGGLLTHKVSQRTLRGKAAQLIQLGLLRRVGQGKSTRYAR